MNMANLPLNENSNKADTVYLKPKSLEQKMGWSSYVNR